MFRQVILSSSKLPKHPTPSSKNTSMVHKESTSSKTYVDESVLLVDKDSWRQTGSAQRKSFSRSISLEHLKDDTPSRKWKDVILGVKPRPQSAKVPATVCTREESEQAAMSVEDKSDVHQDRKSSIAVSIQVEEEKVEKHIKERLHRLASAFSTRSDHVKAKIVEPISRSPSPEELDASQLETLRVIDEDWIVEKRKKPFKEQALSNLCRGAIDPQSVFYIGWLAVVCIAFLWSAFTILLRAVFPYQTEQNLAQFLMVDYFFDSVYLVDMIMFKSRVRFIESGQLIEDLRKCRSHYMKSFAFRMDFMSLLPLDLLYLRYGPYPLLRLPRVLKIHSFWEFFNRIDAAAKSPYIIRILRTLIYMMYLVHLNACAYYAMSVWEGLGVNDWVYNNKGNAYLRCFYFAIRTATSISGKMPKPNNTYEYIFMTLSWLLGVFVFAFLIGQIRDIVATATQNKTFYRQIMDQSIRYMQNLNLPERMQLKVRLWLNHTWEQQNTFEEGKILNLLPSKMKADIALSVHYQMLKKVDLFKECERSVIRDLVVKLKPVLFLPGDYICRKGETGQEMYIVSKGKVCVTEGSKILVTLSEGSVFGEISVLGIPGCSRRNADVRSLGYSNLFILSKTDLWDTLQSYPETQGILRRKAKNVMRERIQQAGGHAEEELEVESIIKDQRPETPRLLRTVMQVLPTESKFTQYISRSSSIISATPSQLSCARSSFDASSSFGGSGGGGSCVSVSMSQMADTATLASVEQPEPRQPDMFHNDNVNANLLEHIIHSASHSG